MSPPSRGLGGPVSSASALVLSSLSSSEARLCPECHATGGFASAKLDWRLAGLGMLVRDGELDEAPSSGPSSPDVSRSALCKQEQTG